MRYRPNRQRPASTSTLRWPGYSRGATCPADNLCSDTLFVFENYPVDTTLLQIPNDGIRVHDVRVAEQWRYPLHVIAGPGEEMQLDVLYDANRFETGTVDGMVEHLRDTLRTIVADPSQRVADLVTPSE